MTGPEHYKEAERLLASVVGIPLTGVAELAQVHATLALAAATADLFALYGQVGDESKDAWRKAVTP